MPDLPEIDDLDDQVLEVLELSGSRRRRFGLQVDTKIATQIRKSAAAFTDEDDAG